MRENKKYLTYAVGGLLLLLLMGGIYGYFGVLSPLHQKIASVDSEIQQQKNFLKKTEPNAETLTTQSENTFTLQEEVPVKPLVDQLMLQFEKAEVLSDSLIMTMQFSDGEALEDEEDVVEATADNATDEEDRTDENTGTAEENLSNEEAFNETKNTPDTAAPEMLPEGVKKVTAEMSVVSKNYNGLLKFLRTIEELKRVTVIEAITFSGLDELEMASAEVTPDQLKFEITVSAYYLPELTDYLKDLPRRGEFSAPGGKENPLTGGEEDIEE
jgi:type IV pilus assembly protein PilO